MPTIAVTGAGAVVGHGVIKSIRRFGALRDSRIIGIDMNPDSAGFMDCDDHYVCRKVSSPGYMEELLDVCRKEKVDVFIPLIEDEFIQVDENRRRFNEAGTQVILQPRAILDLFMDKYLTAVALKSAGIPVPDTILFTPGNMSSISGMAERFGYPLLAKPRQGRSSKGQVIIYSEREMTGYMDILKDRHYVIQEFLSEEDQEFTCGIFNTPDMSEPYTIALKRKLLNGTTISVEAILDPSLAGLCRDIARRFPMNGPLNVQVRKKNGIPYVFEINPRFSSTSYMRAMCGFNDVEMGIRYVLDHHIADVPRIDRRKIVRYFEERYISCS